MRSSCLIFLILATLWIPTVAGARSNAVVSEEAYTHAQALVAVDHGRRLNLYCLGEGSPTVVFDAGMGDTTATWGLVQPEVAEYTRTCSYDRAGLGFSDPATRPGTSASSADDLHRLLRAARIAPPYILVGHSLGGLNVRLYADRHLPEVAGMVLVDPSQQDQQLWNIMGLGARAKFDAYLVDLRTCITTARTGFLPGSDRFKMCIPTDSDQYSSEINAALLRIHESVSFQLAWWWEYENVYDASADQERAGRRCYGDMPLIVLTHSPFPKGPDETQDQRDARTRRWEEVVDQIATLSTHGVNRTVTDSGHYIQLNQPQVVIDAILEVLDATRDPSVPSRKGG